MGFLQAEGPWGLEISAFNAVALPVCPGGTILEGHEKYGSQGLTVFVF